MFKLSSPVWQGCIACVATAWGYPTIRRAAAWDAENASKVDQAKAAEAASIENDENKSEHGTLKDEFSSDEYIVEKTTSTHDKE